MGLTRIDFETKAGAAEAPSRERALTRFLDWAEREAAAIGAHDCGVCLQLARIALESRDEA